MLFTFQLCSSMSCASSRITTAGCSRSNVQKILIRAWCILSAEGTSASPPPPEPAFDAAEGLAGAAPAVVVVVAALAVVVPCNRCEEATGVFLFSPLNVPCPNTAHSGKMKANGGKMMAKKKKKKKKKK